MIDLHSHVLPGIDDGPKTIEGSIALARAAANLGVRTLVATPHVSVRFPNRANTILRLVDELNARLAAEEVGLEVRSGAELAPTQLPQIESSELSRLCLGGGPWLLLESPRGVAAPSVCPAATQLQRRGFRVLLAHPECCPAFQRAPAALESLVSEGAVTSITAGALVGRFGRRIRSFAVELVRGGLAHSVASDAHDRRYRPPGMALELEQAGLSRLADWLTEEVPAAILSGGEIPPRPDVGVARASVQRPAWWGRIARESLGFKRAWRPR